jgi:diguanylate cyclase (GGDEF)-like protein
LGWKPIGARAVPRARDDGRSRVSLAARVLPAATERRGADPPAPEAPPPPAAPAAAVTGDHAAGLPPGIPPGIPHGVPKGRRGGGSRGRHRWVPIAVSAVLGILGSALLALVFVNADARTAQAAFDERARDDQDAMVGALQHAMAALRLVQGYMAMATHPVGRAEFAAVVRTVRDALPLDLSETAWVQHVTSADRAVFEQTARAEGFRDFEIRERGHPQHLATAGDRPDYFPILYIDPRGPADRLLGFDFGSEARRREALNRALATRRPAATAPLRGNLVHANDGSVFILVAPVFGGGGQGLGALRGAVLGVMATGPLVEHMLARLPAEDDLDIYLFDPAAPPETRRIYWHAGHGGSAAGGAPTEAALRARPHAETQLRVADQRWGMLIARPPQARRARLGGRALAVLLAGLAITAGLVAYLSVTLRQALRLEALTDRLRRAAADLATKGEEVTHLAHHDALTGLPNRLAFNERLRGILGDHAHSQPCVLCLDLDRFKSINDTFGHPAGDALLGLVAARLRACLRPEDIVARMGGDEFAILLEHEDRPGAEALAQRLVTVISQPYEIRGSQMTIGISLGIAFPSGGSADADLLMRNADLALYRAKQAGRGTWCFFAGEMETEAQARRTMEANLRSALLDMTLELHFQPLISLRDRRICGMEALLRWNCPGIGPVSPAEFIPLAEECGLIVPIGHWVLQAACREAATWPATMRVAVNLSAAQFVSPTLVASVVGALAESGLVPARLELEITETVLLQDSHATLETLYALKALGVSISMDDFGTGYSSLSYLCQFPFDTLKIDQSFVRDMPLREECRAIVHAVVGLCRNLGITTIAEGVETEQQLRGVLVEQCDEAQGYLFSRPVPVSQVPALIEALRQPVLA